MAGVDALQGAGAWPRVKPWLRWALLGGWVLWAVTAWWTAPRESTVEQAIADAQAGRIVAHQSAETIGDANRSSLWFTPVRLTSEQQGVLTEFVVWRTDFGRVHYAQVLRLEPENGMPLDGKPPEARQLEQVLGLDEGTTIPWFPPVLAATIALLSLAILIQGPAPKLGTRWFWFFLGGLPYGIGMLLWLRAERPWTEPEDPAPDRKTGQPKRYSGLTGLGLLILGGIVISIVVALLRALPEWLIPSALP
ncbi:hypothetical protein O7635_04120 [Asanoa sp. WMMD1127]|uniref:hypothetical protein n=1 Tax=Asanoa sp. WMMD1127 TaxID=3016107 RepID=UPI0024176C1A|nr:hypothetical protein [Asanoa sp. WMMD1127]MDG4821039.1 hypothetical protein [Asanoa sp. WMMD1127]